jgi:serralysin
MLMSEQDYVLSDEFFPDAEDASLDPDAGGTMYGKTIWTPKTIADYITRTNTSWLTTGKQSDADQQTINYAFFNTQADVAANGYTYTLGGISYGLSEYFGFSAFTEAQRSATREAFGYWDDVVAVSFKETSAAEGDINLGNLTNRPGTQAYARLPSASVSSNATVNAQAYDIVGDVWVTATTPSNFQLDEGLYGMNTLTHEIGHSLGLSHPGNYNFAPGFAITYVNGAEYAQDIRNYTIMSYWNPREVGIQDHDYNMGTIAYGSTPMIHDILAAQKLYGADMTTRTGNSTYGFNASADTAGRDALDFTKTPAPVMTIWDAGGNDTLDASGYNTNQKIDLTPGSLSSIGGVTLAEAPSLEQVNANRMSAGYAPLAQASYDIRMNNLKANPDAGLLVDNVGIAYGVTIENAVGGGGNDIIVGNKASNKLSGGAGNDVISGGAGIDYVTGGAGSDIFIADINGSTMPAKRGPLALDVITDFASGSDKIDLRGIDASLSLSGDQAFAFKGSSANKNAADLTFKVYDSINGAEKALGIEIDGLSGPGAATPVTVVFGNVDGGEPDFGIVLVGATGVTSADFML